MLAHGIIFRRTHDLSECAYLIDEMGISLPITTDKLAL